MHACALCTVLAKRGAEFSKLFIWLGRVFVCICSFSVGLFWFYRDDVNSNIMDAKYSTYIGCAILAVVLVVSPVIIFLVRNATNTIQVSFFPSFAFIHITHVSNKQNRNPISLFLPWDVIVCLGREKEDWKLINRTKHDCYFISPSSPHIYLFCHV